MWLYPYCRGKNAGVVLKVILIDSLEDEIVRSIDFLGTLLAWRSDWLFIDGRKPGKCTMDSPNLLC